MRVRAVGAPELELRVEVVRLAERVEARGGPSGAEGAWGWKREGGGRGERRHCGCCVSGLCEWVGCVSGLWGGGVDSSGVAWRAR